MKIIGRFYSKNRDSEDLAAKSAAIGAIGYGASGLSNELSSRIMINNLKKEGKDKELIEKVIREAKKTNPGLKISNASHEDIIEDLYSKELKRKDISPTNKKILKYLKKR
jgi:O-acetyl-ADP-ribose deacetylase (regulator of RNase III)